MDDTTYQQFLQTFECDARHSDLVKRYVSSLEDRLSVFFTNMVVQGAITYCSDGKDELWIFCHSWSTTPSITSTEYHLVNIKYTRGEVLRRLDMIVNSYNELTKIIAGILPQPLSEEIAPRVYMIDNVIDVFRG